MGEMSNPVGDAIAWADRSAARESKRIDHSLKRVRDVLYAIVGVLDRAGIDTTDIWQELRRQ